MTSLSFYSFDDMWVKERQAELQRQAEQARQQREARQTTRRTRVHRFRAIADYLAAWRQRLSRQAHPDTCLETYEPTARIRHAAP